VGPGNSFHPPGNNFPVVQEEVAGTLPAGTLAGPGFPASLGCCAIPACRSFTFLNLSSPIPAPIIPARQASGHAPKQKGPMLASAAIPKHPAEGRAKNPEKENNYV
jgi:hypothetical protein